MLDIILIRKTPRIVEEDLKKRGDTEKLKWVPDLIKKDTEWREAKQELDKLRHKRNEISLKINELIKQKNDTTQFIKQAKALPNKIKQLEEKETQLKRKIDFYLMRLPNVMHPSVPIGKDSSENKQIRTFGQKSKFNFELKPHGELIEQLKIADFDKATEVSGQGFNYIKGELALLDQALMQFAIQFLVKRGYTLIEPPLMIRKKPYTGVTDLEFFEEQLYKIEGEDLYLIATSEHSMAAFYMNEILEEKDLPIKLCGISPCFRKEIGSHGIDTRGFFRMHQFYKIEQFIFCHPKDSWKLHEELQKNSEDMYKQLKIPFRTVNVCTGDLGSIAAKKYDLEAWFPRQNKYGEVGSNSNCTDYQARRLKIRFKDDDGEVKYVHTLNNTGIATSRALVAILENYQQKDGSIKIPRVLQKYMNNIKIIKKK